MVDTAEVRAVTVSGAPKYQEREGAAGPEVLPTRASQRQHGAG